MRRRGLTRPVQSREFCRADLLRAGGAGQPAAMLGPSVFSRAAGRGQEALGHVDTLTKKGAVFCYLSITPVPAAERPSAPLQPPPPGSHAAATTATSCAALLAGRGSPIPTPPSLRLFTMIGTERDEQAQRARARPPPPQPASRVLGF